MPDFDEIKQKLNDRMKSTPPVRLIVVSFFLLIIVGTLLLALPVSHKEESVSLLDSFFTATSATCVTGLAVADTFHHWSIFGQGVILCLIQLGGLGLATFAIGFTLLVRRKLGIREILIVSESSGGNMLNMAFLLRLVLGFTFACEAVGAAILMLRFVPLYGTDGIWPAIFVAVSAYCNAGFDILGFVSGNSSISAFAGDPLVCLTISALIIIGGLGFVVVQDIYESKIRPRFHHKDTGKLNFHSQICLRVTAVLLIIGTLAFLVLEFDNSMKDLNFFEKLNAAFFQSTNTRTAGFASVNIAEENEFTKIISIVLMFIGGCPGSTAGGIKVTTFVVLLITVISTIRGREESVILKHRFATGLVYKSLTVVSLAIVLIFVDAGIIAALNPDVSMLDAVFEAVSAFGTVGLSANVTPQLDWISKLLLCFTMFVGRVGPISFGLSIMMRHKRGGDSILPEGRMIIG